MSDVWLAVVVVSVATILLKASGPLLLARRGLPDRVAGVVEMLAPALLAALVVTQAIGGNRRYIFDARLLGLAAATVAIRLRVPLLGVVVLAAAVTAIARVVS